MTWPWSRDTQPLIAGTDLIRLNTPLDMASLDGQGSEQGIYSVIPVSALNTDHEYRVSTGSWLPLMNTVGGSRAGQLRMSSQAM